MTFSRRRLAALVIAPLLVVGLVACAGVEPEATQSPTPTPTPTPTETVAAPTMPTSRVPVTCDELFASPLVSGSVASSYGSPSVKQAGYLGCVYQGMFDGRGAAILIDVSVDPPIDELNRVLGWPEDTESVTCDDEGWGCYADFVSASYVVDFSLEFSEISASNREVAPLFEAFAADLKQQVASWPAAAPLWQPPADAMRWAFDCPALIPRQDVVHNAVPFPLGDAFRPGSDTRYMSLLAQAATSMTSCVFWNDGAGVTVELLPGGAWMHEAGIPLQGDPYSLEGALAAVSVTDYGDSRVSAYIDGSLVTVGVSPPEGSGIDGYAVAEDVIAALVIAF